MVVCFFSFLNSSNNQILQQSNFTVQFSKVLFYIQKTISPSVGYRLRQMERVQIEIPTWCDDVYAARRIKAWREWWISPRVTDAVIISTDSREKQNQIVLMSPTKKPCRLDTSLLVKVEPVATDTRRMQITCYIAFFLFSCLWGHRGQCGANLINVIYFWRFPQREREREMDVRRLRLEAESISLQCVACNCIRFTMCNLALEKENKKRSPRALHWILYRLLVSFFDSRLEWASFLASTLCTNKESNQPLSLLFETLLHRRWKKDSQKAQRQQHEHIWELDDRKKKEGITWRCEWHMGSEIVMLVWFDIKKHALLCERVGWSFFTHSGVNDRGISSSLSTSVTIKDAAIATWTWRVSEKS